ARLAASKTAVAVELIDAVREAGLRADAVGSGPGWQGGEELHSAAAARSMAGLGDLARWGEGVGAGGGRVGGGGGGGFGGGGGGRLPLSRVPGDAGAWVRWRGVSREWEVSKRQGERTRNSSRSHPHGKGVRLWLGLPFIHSDGCGSSFAFAPRAVRVTPSREP